MKKLTILLLSSFLLTACMSDGELSQQQIQRQKKSKCEMM